MPNGTKTTPTPSTGKNGREEMTTTREVGGWQITPGLYRHIKSGGLYTVFGLVRHHETGTPMVVYYSHQHGSVSTRPIHGFTTPRCSDPDGFVERFALITDRPGSVGQPPLDGLQPTLLWTSATLLRNFELFEAALGGVGKPPEAKSGASDAGDDHLAAVVAELEHALEMLRKEQFERAKQHASSETPNVGAPPNASDRERGVGL
jgi:hypothetical protein